MSGKGDEILLRARQHFRSQRTVESLRQIDVPEWSATVYFWPTRSMAERLAVERHVRVVGDRNMADMVALHAAQVCARARDEHGHRLFTDEQEQDLADTAPAVVERISLLMGFGDGLTLEAAEKN